VAVPERDSSIDDGDAGRGGTTNRHIIGSNSYPLCSSACEYMKLYPFLM
jgi:hypothetical protein